MGDWNQDSAGPTALLKGDLLGAWQALDQACDLEDMYTLAENKRGPSFTRQVYTGERLDQARLDRLYFTNRGRWIARAVNLLHDDHEALSDHIPIVADIRLAGYASTRKKKRDRYLKMDVDTLKDPVRRELAKLAWLEGWNLSVEGWNLSVIHKVLPTREGSQTRMSGLPSFVCTKHTHTVTHADVARRGATGEIGGSHNTEGETSSP
ncbi:hypothetical protein R1sor_022092 [Riccia sorocarpa]|uniref:Endonuclease/exonuclease/phosphatase domain-containing protein n=1 Tax=Riccia sorocarpa TaxID=122646 RepID=A0ABD3GMP1_9MARC